MDNLLGHYLDQDSSDLVPACLPCILTHHRDHSIHMDRANIDSQDNDYTRSFDMGLASAESQKLVCFE